MRTATGSVRARWRGARIDVPHASARLAGLALLGLVRGVLETAIIVEVIAVAVSAAGGRPDGLPLLDALPPGPLPLVAAVVATTALVAGVRWWSEHLIATVSTEAMVRTRMRLLRSYCRADWLEQSSERAGALQELFTTAVNVIGNGTIIAAGALVAAVHLAVVTVSAVLLSPLAALAVLGIGTLAVLLGHPFRARTRRMAEVSAGAGSDLATVVAETTQLGRELRTNGVQDTVAEQARPQVVDAARLFSRVRFEARLVPALTRDLTVAAVAVGLGLLSLVSTVAVGSLGAAVLLLIRAIAHGQQVSAAVQTLADRRAHLDRLDAVLLRYERSAPGAASSGLRSEATREGGATEAPGARASGASANIATLARGGRRLDRIGTVRLDAVGFSYPGAERPVLRDVTLPFAAGEVVGIAGPSGAGKSTLLYLLLGLVRPTGGRVTVAGVDLADVDPADWFRRVAFVPQNPRLLTGTVAENIRFLRTGLTDAAVERAAVAAALGPDLAGWPDGLAHPVGPLGNALSGGQRQRVVLARALAGAPELLILDEPTSALDAASEAAVRATIERVRGTATVVIVAHRPSTLDVCDRVVELRDGCLVGAALAVG